MSSICEEMFITAGLPNVRKNYWTITEEDDKAVQFQQNFDEDFNTFLEKNNIEMDEDGNFEAYIVVDADDEDCCVNAIVCNKNTFAYNKENALEDLKGNRFTNSFVSSWIYTIIVEKQKSIREELLTLEDKMFKVLVNKKDVVGARDTHIVINKYKIIEKVILKPILKYKIKNMDINSQTANVILYNNITEKNVNIYLLNISGSYLDKSEGIQDALIRYLKEDEDNVNIINSVADEGIEL